MVVSHLLHIDVMTLSCTTDINRSFIIDFNELDEALNYYTKLNTVEKSGPLLVQTFPS